MAGRLTNDMRDMIRNRVLRHRFAPQITALEAEFADLALQVYNDVFKASDRKRMDELPEGWLPTSETITVQFPGSYTTLYFNGRYADRYTSLHQSTKEARNDTEHVFRRFTQQKCGSCVAMYERGALANTYDSLTGRAKDLNKEISEAGSMVGDTTARFYTIDKLLEGWPEIEPFTKGLGATSKPSPIAIPTETLNASLGLPKPRRD